MTPIGFSTLTFLTNLRGLTTGPTKEAICIYQTLVKQRTLINTSTMDTAVDAAVIRGLKKWPKSSGF